MARQGGGMQKNSLDKRFRKYEKYLKQDPVMLQAIYMCEKHNIAESTDEDRMFLHTFAPVIIHFTLWVIREALKSGKKRLYFLARDGYYMYHVAKLLKIESIEYRYLKVSRYSIRSAQYHILGDRSIDYICTGGIDVTFEKVMKRAMLTDDEAMEMAKLAGYEKRYKQVLNYNEVMALKPILRNIPKFMEIVAFKAEQLYPETIAYLKQEGMFDDIDYAIVDSGWIGTLQRSLQELLQKTIEGYYFGLFEIPKDMDRQQYHAYYFGGDKGINIKNIKSIISIRRKAHFANSLFEAVCSAPEPMTLGYKKEHDRVIPIGSEKNNPNAENITRNLKLIQTLMEEYIQVLSATEKNINKNGKQIFSVTERKINEGGKKVLSDTEKFLKISVLQIKDTACITEKILSMLMAKPIHDEAKYFGSYIFCDDLLEQQLQPVAALLTKEDIKNQRLINKALILKGIKKATIHESAWLEGSVRLMETAKKATPGLNKSISFEFWHVLVYKYILHIRKALKK